MKLWKGLEQIKTEIAMKFDDLRNEGIDNELADFNDDQYRIGFLHGLYRAQRLLEDNQK